MLYSPFEIDKKVAKTILFDIFFGGGDGVGGRGERERVGQTLHVIQVNGYTLWGGNSVIFILASLINWVLNCLTKERGRMFVLRQSVRHLLGINIKTKPCLELRKMLNRS